MSRDLSLTPQRILFASGEPHALSCFSDIAEFTSTLATALTETGHDVRLVLPAYPALLAQSEHFTRIARIRIPGSKLEARILQGKTDLNLNLYLVDIPDQFNEPDHGDAEACIRFGLFSRIVALLAVNQAGGNWQPDLLHCCGWQSALAISLLASEWSRPATIYSLHQADHRSCQTEQINVLSLPVELLKSGALAMQGSFSFEKGAILMADQLVLPSREFRDELLQEQTGHPLLPQLNKRVDQLTGIPSGIDYQRWGPTADPFIEQHYDSASFELKRLNRQRLLDDLQLSLDDRRLLIGYPVSKHDSTGLQQIASLLETLTADSPVHILVAAGETTPALQPLYQAAKRFPGQLSILGGTDEARWHNFVAGIDCLLLPARLYPSPHLAQCALSYGTVPIAHASQSIQATVTDATPANLLHGIASGFLYHDATIGQLGEAIDRVSAFHAKPAIWWHKLASQGMAQSFPASEMARHYLQCYQAALDNPVPSQLA